MEPFRVPEPLRALRVTHPEAKLVLHAASDGGKTSCDALARLWLSEGIPYAFTECPAVYEVLRGWLAIRLDVDPKDISLTGSARIGSSLSPRKCGVRFSADSDLDLFIVSEILFNKLREEFKKWTNEFNEGIVKPKNPRERKFWLDNAARGLNLLDRGFIDQKMIPNLQNYPVVKSISQGMFLLIEKLKITVDAPKPKLASIRCYKSWKHAIQQISLNLERSSKELVQRKSIQELSG